MNRGLKHRNESSVSRLHLSIGLAVLGLLVSSCVSTSRTLPQVQAFGSGVKQRPHAVRELKAPKTVEELLRRGDALHSDGTSASAMWAYLQAHELDLNDPKPVSRMASLHLEVDPRLAESIFRKLAETHPGSSTAHTGIGLTLMERDAWDEAREVLVRAVSIDPNSAVAHSALGVSLDRLGQHAKAREAYLRATALQPRYYEALNNLGVSYLATGEFVAAEQALRAATLEQSRDPAVFNNLGVALGRQGLYDEALKAFQRAGSEQAVRNNLGYVCFLNGEYARAIEEYEKALHANGDQKLRVLRNLRAARRAEKALVASTESRSELR